MSGEVGDTDEDVGNLGGQYSRNISIGVQERRASAEGPQLFF